MISYISSVLTAAQRWVGIFVLNRGENSSTDGIDSAGFECAWEMFLQNDCDGSESPAKYDGFGYFLAGEQAA